MLATMQFRIFVFASGVGIAEPGSPIDRVSVLFCPLLTDDGSTIQLSKRRNFII
jgi:hypothetical protein